MYVLRGVSTAYLLNRRTIYSHQMIFATPSYLQFFPSCAVALEYHLIALFRVLNCRNEICGISNYLLGDDDKLLDCFLP
jgi:hypothetical protein